MAETVSVRSRTAQALGAAMGVAAAVVLVSLALDDPGTALGAAGPLALFGLLGWAAFWRPRVEVSDGGVEVVNTLRTVEVPWPAVDEVEGRYGLRLRTAYGPVTAWAAAAPSGRDRAAGRSSAAAEAVQQRLDQLRAAGHLDERRLERLCLRVHWHRPVLVAVGLLAVLSLVAAALG